MQYVKKATLWFEPTTGHDTPEIEGYKLYVIPSPLALTRDADGSVPGADTFVLGKPAVDADGKCRVDLSILPNMPTKDGVYNLGIVSVDDAGNESSFYEMLDIPLDFAAPDPVLSAGILRV
jgi:hypothetical protein